MTSDGPAHNPHDRYAAARQRMVDAQLRRRDIRDPAVLDTLAWVPRELFVRPEQRAHAYRDGAMPVDCGQTISQPYMVARMTELAAVGPDARVLEVGTGTGYQTAVLARLAAHVYTIEWHMRLMNDAAERLRTLGLDNVSYRCGDGSVGWPARAPFDAIVVTAGAPAVPQPLETQLAEGGRMVVPVGAFETQTLMLVRRTRAGIKRENVLQCRFVKLLGAAGWQP
jgi:protein-L-isoaspartate(D-aspartate) O-methyltransferase